MSIFEELINTPLDIRARTVSNNRQTPIKADNKLFLCTICRNVWEYERNSNGTKKLLRYDHLPRYGKSKKVCEVCE